jgi:hypothetical protein
MLALSPIVELSFRVTRLGKPVSMLSASNEAPELDRAVRNPVTRSNVNSIHSISFAYTTIRLDRMPTRAASLLWIPFVSIYI